MMKLRNFIFVSVLFSTLLINSKGFAEDPVAGIRQEIGATRQFIQSIFLQIETDYPNYSYRHMKLATAQNYSASIINKLLAVVPVLQMKVVRAFQANQISSVFAMELIAEINTLLVQPPLSYLDSVPSVSYRWRGGWRGFFVKESEAEPAMKDQLFQLPTISPEIVAALIFKQLDSLVIKSPSFKDRCSHALVSAESAALF